MRNNLRNILLTISAVAGLFVMTYFAVSLEILSKVFALGCISGLGEIPVPESLLD